MNHTLYALVAAVTPLDPTTIDRFVAPGTGLERKLAELIMSIVDWVLGAVGLEHHATLVTFLYAAVVFAVSIVVGYIAKWIIFKVLKLVTKRWSSDMYDFLHQARFFSKLCRMIPALTFLVLIQFTLSNHTSLAGLLTRVTLIYVVFVSAIALSALVHAIWKNVDMRENKKKLPLKGLAQLVKGIIWMIAIVIVIAIIVDKSPGALIAGLGAFAAVLMLVFKDTILSLVAGIQMSEDESLHVGDWIKVDGTDANGTVTEVNLISVKVENWDKTTTTLPPYSLVSSGFTNYRSMQHSDTRRICRSYLIDSNSVEPATDELLARVRSVPFMSDYIDGKLREKAAGTATDANDPSGLVDGTIDTNLGLFRAYIKMWLDSNPDISHKDDCFVTLLAQTSLGIPLQVYCFTNTSSWIPYEAIQSSVFEHLASMLHFFRLYTFQQTSSRATVVSGYASAGGSLDNVIGVPEPFLEKAPAPAAPQAPAAAPAGK